MNETRLLVATGSLGPGGSERQLVAWLDALTARLGTVQVVNFGAGGDNLERLQALGVPVIDVASQSQRQRVTTLARAARNIGANIIHSQHPFTNVYGTIVGRGLRIPVVGSLRTRLHFVREGMRGAAVRIAMSGPNEIWVNSTEGERDLLTWGHARSIRMIPNAVALGDVAPASPTPRLAFVGRLSEEKRPDLAIGVLDRLATEANPGLVFGSGPLESQLRDRYGQSPRLHFLGHQEPAQIWPQVDLLVISSTVEGTPNAALEAMACGVTVVSTPVGDMPHLLASGRGIVLSTTSPTVEDYCAAIQPLLERPAAFAERGACARAYVAEHHDLVTITEMVGARWAELARKR